jgi:hypothetical protein
MINEGMKLSKSDINWPVFLLGTQRSGTTLLTRILSAHPQIYIQNELELPNIFNGENSTDSVIQNIKKEIEQTHGISIDDMLAKEECKIWGLKDPQLTNHIDILRNFLPHAKFIIIVRDGRGVANSYIENKWGLGTNAYSGAERWKREVEQQIDFMNEYPDNFLFIRFEDMVKDLKTTMINVCDHLKLPFDETMLEYNKEASYYEVKPENKNTFKKPDIKLAEKWTNKLTSHQIDVIENVAGELLLKLKYPIIGKTIKISFVERLFYKVHQAIAGEIQLQYKWRRFRIKDYLRDRKKSNLI